MLVVDIPSGYIMLQVNNGDDENNDYVDDEDYDDDNEKEDS